METYSEYKNRQQLELNALPMQFAFNNKQFKKGMEALGLTVDQTDKVVSIPGGGFMLKTEAHKLADLFIRHKKEFKECVESDNTGNAFMLQAFNYELANHEYCITGDSRDALESLGLTMEDVKNNLAMEKAFELAISRQQNY